MTPRWRPHERFNCPDSEKCMNQIERYTFRTAEKIIILIKYIHILTVNHCAFTVSFLLNGFILLNLQTH